MYQHILIPLENSAADEPDVGKNLAVSWVLDELPLVVAQKVRGGGGGITVPSRA